jgi:sterol desaturase/sphingolipid hydroxylase (fatty acid hydroxylase superfamily)
MLVFAAFWALVAGTWALRGGLDAWRGRRGEDTLLDLTGLLVQGAAVPALEVTLVLLGLRWAAPAWEGALHLPGPLAFLLNFVVVDYLYYWNHRLLHTGMLWPAHAVHHGADRMDVLVTARNTLWSPLLILYVWVNGLCLYVLADPTAFALGAAVTAALDLWRHSTLGPRPGTAAYRLLGALFVTPHDHAWHHATDDTRHNFGANFKLWDVIHGTWRSPAHAPRLGVADGLPFWRRLLLPFPGKR